MFVCETMTTCHILRYARRTGSAQRAPSRTTSTTAFRTLPQVSSGEKQRSHARRLVVCSHIFSSHTLWALRDFGAALKGFMDLVFFPPKAQNRVRRGRESDLRMYAFGRCCLADETFCVNTKSKRRTTHGTRGPAEGNPLKLDSIVVCA